MPDVNLMIHGRTYGVGCDDGQEKRVKELGQYIDKRVREIASAGGAATEAHLLVLSCLVMADELFESREGQQQMRNQVNAMAQELEAAQSAPSAKPAADPAQLTAMQQQLFAAQAQAKAAAKKIEDLTAHVEQLEEQLTAPTEIAVSTNAANSSDPELDAKIVGTIEQLAGRLEGIAKRLQAA